MKYFSALSKFTNKPRQPDDIARAFARAFATTDGKTVLEHLHHHAMFRINDPALAADQLKFFDGQRQLVLWICQMIAKGNNPTQ